MSDWWKFDKDDLEVIDHDVPLRVCQVCGAPINPDLHRQPLAFCDVHTAERAQVQDAVAALDKRACAALGELQVLAEAHPEYMPFVGRNAAAHVEAVLALLIQQLDRQAARRAAVAE